MARRHLCWWMVLMRLVVVVDVSVGMTCVEWVMLVVCRSVNKPGAWEGQRTVIRLAPLSPPGPDPFPPCQTEQLQRPPHYARVHTSPSSPSSAMPLPSSQNGVRERLPTLDEVLLRKTRPPVDLFCFYVRTTYSSLRSSAQSTVRPASLY